MRKFLLSLVALVGLSTALAYGNYTMTQGAGTTFGSTIVGGIHYVQMFVCDLTTPGQCAAVSAAGAVKVDGSAVTQPISGTITSNVGTGTRPVSIASGQVASGAFSSGAFASGSYALGSIGSGAMVDLGAIADAAATAGGTGTLSAKMRLMTTQLATINTTLNAPMQQTGGTVTANLGTIAGVSTATNQTSGGQKTQVVDGSGNVQPSGDAAARAIFEKLTDGTNTAGVAAASTPPAATVPALVTISRADDPLLTTASTVLAATARNTNTYTTGNVVGMNANLNGAPYVENAPSGTAGTSCSVTVTTGGTAQNLFTGQTNVQQVVIMDIDTGKTEGIWVSWLGTAAPNTVDSFYIPPYSATAGAGSFSLPAGLHPTAISVYAATTGHKVSCSRS